MKNARRAAAADHKTTQRRRRPPVRRRTALGETRLWVGRRGTMDGSIRHNCQFEGDRFWDVLPVKTAGGRY